MVDSIEESLGSLVNGNDSLATSTSSSSSGSLEVIYLGRRPVLTMASLLTKKGSIAFPTIFALGAWDLPDILDNIVATSVLKELLSKGDHPPAVLWTSFLKNNCFLFDRYYWGITNAIHWFSQHPDRLKHISRLAFSDFFSHDRVRHNAAGKRIPYRPNMLMKHCPNLRLVYLDFEILDFPGFRDVGQDSYIDEGVMIERFEKRYCMRDFFAGTGEAFGRIDLRVRIPRRLWKAEERVREGWMRAIRLAFAQGMVDAGRNWEGVTVAGRWELY